jgi:hypothetical protein
MNSTDASTKIQGDVRLNIDMKSIHKVEITTYMVLLRSE